MHTFGDGACASIFLKGRQKVGNDVSRNAIAVSGGDVTEAEHQERQEEEQAGNNRVWEK